MKQKLLNSLRLRLCLLVACILCVGGKAWGETFTYNFSSGGTHNSDELNTWTTDYFTITQTKNGTTTGVANYLTAPRWYKNHAVIFTPATNVEITQIVINATSTNSGQDMTASFGTVTKSGNNSTWTGSATSTSPVTLTMGSQCRPSSVVVTYTSSGPTLETSDLAITDAPVALSFDLYNNSAAQTVSFTSSSTGAVTVSESEYVTTSVSGQTITVTPVKVTPSAQTITISQAADETYAAGSATFTVNISDCTPFEGGDVTFDAKEDKGTSPLVKNGITFTCTNGVLNNGSEYRLYKNSTTTFSTTSGKITKIVFTGVSGNPVSGFGETEGLTTSGNNGTWTGNASSVSFTASDAQVRASKIVVTITPDGAVVAPTISGTTPFLGSSEITISAVDGATIYYTTDGTKPTTGSTQYTAPFSIEATTTVKAIATKDGKTSEVASREFVKTESFKLNETSGLTAGDYILEFENAVVTYVKDQYAFIEDANGAILYYKNGHGLTAGQVINGYKTVTWAIFNGQPEATTINDINATAGSETPQPTVATIANLLANPNTYMSKFVKLEGVLATGTTSNFILSQNGSEIAFYGRNSAAVEDGKTYDIIGFLGKHNEEYQFVVYTPDHITEAGVEYSETPTIAVTEGTDGAKVVTISAAEGATIYYTTDGTAPTEESAVYSQPLTFTTLGNYTIKAIAIEEGKTASQVATQTFNVEAPSFITLAAGYTETINTFPSFSGSGYKTIGDYQISVNGVAYDWSVTDGMKSGNDLQLKASSGELTSPEIRTPYGYTVTVNYTSDQPMTLSSGESTATGAVADEDLGTSVVTLDVASTAAAFTLATGSKYATVQSITITANSNAPEAYAVVSTDGTNVTFYYDGNKDTREGTKYVISDGSSHPWTDSSSTLTNVTFDASFGNYDGLTSTKFWFSGCTALTAINGLQYLNTENVTMMQAMFQQCSALTSLDLSGWNTSKVEDMSYMFSHCQALTAITFGSSFSTASVTIMADMFWYCDNLTSLDLSMFNTANVTNMSYMFANCNKLTSITGIENFNTAKVHSMEYMFNLCNTLTSLDLSGWNTAYVTNMNYMFQNCYLLNTIYVGDDWTTAAVTNENAVFFGSTRIVGGNGTKYASAHQNKDYARIDGNGGAGYFSHKTKKYVTVGSTCYTTFVPTANVSLAEGVEAYGVDQINESSMHLLPIETAVPNNEPVVIKAAQGVYALPIVESADAVSGNKLLASDGTVQGGDNIFVLANKSQGVGFYPTASTIQIPAGKAYLNTGASSVKGFLAFDFGGADGVNEMTNDELEMTNIFNLAGQRLQKLQKGVNIVGGKKVVVK